MSFPNDFEPAETRVHGSGLDGVGVAVSVAVHCYTFRIVFIHLQTVLCARNG